MIHWSYLLFSLFAGFLMAAPDPDLFDGRLGAYEGSGRGVSESSPEAGAETVASSEADSSRSPVNEAGSSGDSEASVIERNFEGFGFGTTGSEEAGVEVNTSKVPLGQTSAVENSGQSRSKESQKGKGMKRSGRGVSASSPEAGAGTVASSGADSSRSPINEAGSSGDSEASGIERNFEKFGFGTTRSEEAGVKVNTSKASPGQTSAVKDSDQPRSEKSQKGKGMKGSGGTAEHLGNSSGDHGASIPSGI